MLDTKAVEVVDTNLRRLLARNRILGEWMRFSELQLQNAISMAKQLVMEVKENLEYFERAQELKNKISNGLKIDATEEAKSNYAVIQNFEPIRKSCDEVLDEYKKYLRLAIDQGFDVAGRGTIQNKSGYRFDEKLFRKKYPTLFEKFAEISYPVRGSFLPIASKRWSPNLEVIDRDHIDLISNLKKELINADFSMDTVFSLHEKHLGVKECKKYAEWKIEIAKTKLKVFTGENDGIEGICNWKRKNVEVVTLDKKRLETQHPDEFKLCFVQGPEISSLITNKGAGLN